MVRVWADFESNLGNAAANGSHLGFYLNYLLCHFYLNSSNSRYMDKTFFRRDSYNDTLVWLLALVSYL